MCISCNAVCTESTSTSTWQHNRETCACATCSARLALETHHTQRTCALCDSGVERTIFEGRDAEARRTCSSQQKEDTGRQRQPQRPAAVAPHPPLCFLLCSYSHTSATASTSVRVHSRSAFVSTFSLVSVAFSFSSSFSFPAFVRSFRAS